MECSANRQSRSSRRYHETQWRLVALCWQSLYHQLFASTCFLWTAQSIVALLPVNKVLNLKLINIIVWSSVYSPWRITSVYLENLSTQKSELHHEFQNNLGTRSTCLQVLLGEWWGSSKCRRYERPTPEDSLLGGWGQRSWESKENWEAGEASTNSLHGAILGRSQST